MGVAKEEGTDGLREALCSERARVEGAFMVRSGRAVRD